MNHGHLCKFISSDFFKEYSKKRFVEIEKEKACQLYLHRIWMVEKLNDNSTKRKNTLTISDI